MGVLAYINEPVFAQLMAIADPMVYRERFTMPIYAVAATGDEVRTRQKNKKKCKEEITCVVIVFPPG
jgi:PhoPQ-activated pathogenicity-related protein